MQHELAKANFPMLEWYRCQPAAEQVERDWGLTMSDTIRPSAQELKMNSRSRSALLHVLTKQKGVRVQAVEKLAYNRLGWDVVPSRAMQVPP